MPFLPIGSCMLSYLVARLSECHLQLCMHHRVNRKASLLWCEPPAS